MDFNQKIFFSIAFFIGGFILTILIDKINDNLKSKLEISNSDLVESQSWFFSDTKKGIIKWVIIIMIVILVIMIWTTEIDLNK